ncbi:TetR/AcrR family transcriptional regulator [Arthrobacter sp. NPDC090010]|uniref:TetR/AcrR family transcriptional regulator n=1 Tax=Arthrobacter sp. NPDC090010 TaxID=3363942 RepID=UPI0037FBF7BF
MINSASSEGGLRERKRLATSQAITAAARSFTATRGLSGFTVEEVCEEVGISRRTFFNYFHTKEDAVIGSFSDELPVDAVERFVDNPARSAGEISSSLLDALYTFTADVVGRSTVSPAEMRQLIAAIGAEPQLLSRLTAEGQARQQQFRELVATREGLDADHPDIVTVTALFGAVVKQTNEVFFSEENQTPYRELLGKNLRAARIFFSQSLTAGAQNHSEDKA